MKRYQVWADTEKTDSNGDPMLAPEMIHESDSKVAAFTVSRDDLRMCCVYDTSRTSKLTGQALLVACHPGEDTEEDL